VEADESDGTFLKLPADIVVVTNIDSEHLDHYGSFDAMRESFRQFLENVPFYGFAVVCLDHPEVQTLASRIDDRWVITYGANPQADVRFLNFSMKNKKAHFDVLIRSRKTGIQTELRDLVLPMSGKHNVSNATAAIAIAHELGISDEVIRKGLAEFGGVKRRFTQTGSWRGIDVFDDYGHHPVEIKAVLRAARESTNGQVIAIAQPHRYSRLCNLFDDFATCFNDADTVMIAPVYAAGEEPITGFGSKELVEHIQMASHRDVRLIDDLEHVVSIVSTIAKSGDYVVFLGAGSITQWAYALPKRLAELDNNDKFSAN
ncbi:UDP-N-acetylmuramate--L-alanine ligase, partial [Bartonella bacilliformis]